MPVPERYQSAHVLDVRGRLFLIDCGEAVQRRWMGMHLPLSKLDAICLSHIHGDHLFGLFPLLSTLGMGGRMTPLNIYAPSNFGPVLKFFLSYFGDGLSFEIRFVPLKGKGPEVIFEGKSTEIVAFPLNHGIDTYGFLFREKEPMFNVRKEAVAEYGLTLTEIGTLKRGEDVVRRGSVVLPASELAYKPYEPASYAYVSDTAPFPELGGWLKGVSLLYHEATYTEAYADQAAKRHHSTAIQAARTALEAGAGTLLLGHYSSRIKDPSSIQSEARTVFPASFAAQDGDRWDIGPGKSAFKL